MTQTTDVLIIGSGLSGLSVALTLPTDIKVMVLSKDSFTTCSSYYAQGGIAGMLAEEDSVEAHVKDTLIAGAGLCDRHNTHTILQQGVHAIDWLSQQGVPFSKNADDDNLHLTKEGGHSYRRIVHAEDATGKYIMDTLLANAQSRANIQLCSHHEVIELLTTDMPSIMSSRLPSIAGSIRHCYGARVFNHKTNLLSTLTAKAVILASGGLGQLFKRATAPTVSMGDGVMMAWQAGCRLANLEFVQFHPTGLAMTDSQGQASNFLISEAIRGEGGLLLCPVSGERFMQQIHPDGELAPRDIVARGIYQQGIINGKGYVHLDISHRPPSFIKQHFPQIYQHCLQLGLDISKQPIPVAPTAHYSCGGILSNAYGMTDVLGLYAVGEVAYTGLHGANRLASNSLLECVVVGQKVAKHLSQCLTPSAPNELYKQPSLLSQQSLLKHWQFPNPHISPTHQDDHANNPADNPADSQVNNQPSHEPEQANNKQNTSVLSIVADSFDVKVDVKVDIRVDGLIDRLWSDGLYNGRLYSDGEQDKPSVIDVSDTGENKVYQLKQLKQLMTDSMGIIRNQQTLVQALEQITAWQLALADKPYPTASPFSIELHRIRWQRLLMLAKLMIQSAIARKESRGGHYRQHFMDKADVAKISLVNSRYTQATFCTGKNG